MKNENELLMKLETSRKHALDGKVKDADDVIADMMGTTNEDFTTGI